MNIIFQIKELFKSKNKFCKSMVIIWAILCGVMLFSLVIGVVDITVFLTFCIFASLSFFTPALTVIQCKKTTANKDQIVYSDKSWGISLILSIFFGYFGAHRFYTGRKITGIIYIFTFGGCFVGWITDIVLLMMGIFTDGKGRVITNNKSAFGSRSDVNVTTEHEMSRNEKISVSAIQNKVTQKISEIKTSQDNTSTSKKSIFSDVFISGGEEKKQTIPTKSNETATKRSSSIPGITISINGVSIDDLDDDEDSEYGYYSRYSSTSKFIKDMSKYADKDGKEAQFVPFMQYWPTYDSMNKQQQAWYFYWRSEVRNGRYPDTDLSYIFVHIYELISGYGWKTADDGYNKLLNLWMAYRERFDKLDSYLYGWSFDFAQLHNLDFIIPECLDLQLPYQPAIRDLLIDAHSNDEPLKLPFALVDALCDYSLVGSKFYKDGNQMLMNEAIPRVIALADAALIKKKGKGILSTYGPARTKKQSYYAFQSAVCPDANKRIDLSVKGYTSSQKLRNYINELVRYAENILRGMYGYRGRLRGVELDEETASLVEHFLKKEYSPDKEEVKAEKIEVKLDAAAIETLRAQSNAVRDALEVVEDIDKQNPLLTDLDEVTVLFTKLSVNAKKYLKSMYEGEWECSVSLAFKTLAEEINRISNQVIARSLIVVEKDHFIVEDDYRDELEYIFQNNPDLMEAVSDCDVEKTPETQSLSKYFDISHLSEKAEQIVSMLTDIQQEALWIILTKENPQEQLEIIANEAFTMPEILIDEINEISTQLLDDILIDAFGDVPCVLEQYEPEFKDAIIMEVE